MKKKNDGDARNFTPVRFALLCVAILLSLGLLLGRVAWLQIVTPTSLVKQEDMRSLREVTIASPRGMITDREGRPLAVSVPVNAVWADPKTIVRKGGVGYNERWQALAKTLHISLSTLAERVNSNPAGRFIYLARQISPQQAQWVDDLNLPGINLREESRRFYPAGHVAANLIGFTNIDGQGIEGLEKSFNSQLMGKPGSRLVRKDKFGHVIENITEVMPVPAHELQLSIDERLQTVTEDALDNAVTWNKAESGAAVLVNIATGEILSMASFPDFNPNNRDGAVLDDFRNRAISDTFEPGSTVKPLVIMTALQQGIVQPDSVIDTHPFNLDGHRIRDVGFYPELSLTGILQKSSDIGVSHIALAMPAQALVDTYRAFGLGKPTGLGLSGESVGYFPLHRQQWADIERATFSFGYGLRVTPLQIAREYATMGSYGIYRPLSITKVTPPVMGQQIADPNIVKTVVRMMESDVLPGGSGVRAAVPGYRLATKTGTAEKLGNSGKYDGGYVNYTAGVAPVSHPEVALVVVVNNPTAGTHFGGSVAAPIFGNIMGPVLKNMNIAPDALH